MQCTFIKSNKQQCKNKTKNGLCHVHIKNQKPVEQKSEEYNNDTNLTFNVSLSSASKLLSKLKIDTSNVDTIELKIKTKNVVKKLYNEISLDTLDTEIDVLKRNIDDLKKQLEKSQIQYEELRKSNSVINLKHCHYMHSNGSRCTSRFSNYFCPSHVTQVFDVYCNFFKFRKLVDEKKEGCPIPKCDNYKNKIYCKNHEKEFKFEKPEDCPICSEDMTSCQFPLKCGHWAHTECVLKWQDKCPICRKRYVLWDEHNTRSRRTNERELSLWGRTLEKITTDEAFASLISI